MAKKKELGKGIRALLNNIEESDSAEERQEAVKKLSNHIELIPLEDIELNPYQPRKDFDEDQLQELSDSIKAYGIIQAITVRDMKDGSYQLISGERRYRASKMAGLEEVPAYIRIADDTLMLEMALVENIQRENLNALEVAISYQRLLSEFDFTHEQLSEKIGKKRATITNYIRLLKLPPQIQKGLKSDDISMGHARALLGLDDLPLQLKLYQQTILQGLSVRALEGLISKYKKEDRPLAPEVKVQTHPEVEKIRGLLAEKLGFKPLIKRDASGKGEIKIAFASDDEFNNIIDALLDQ